jgi:hypothetical protein
MIRRALIVGAVFLVGGCDCDGDRDREDGRDGDREDAAPAKTADPEPEPEPDPPPPPAQRGDGGPAAPRGRPFQVASITFRIEEGRARAKIKVTIPEGVTVEPGARLNAAIYFDNGPPIAANITATDGAWQSEDLRLPNAVRTADRLAMRISTTPEATAFVWEVTGVWQTAEHGAVTLDTGHAPARTADGGPAGAPDGGPAKAPGKAPAKAPVEEP